MKQRDLMLGLGLLGTFAMQAVTSPYTGSVAGEGTYYLYQVETGQWLEPNKKNVDEWTTLSKLDDTGMDIELKKLDGFSGFQIWCNYTGNGSLNGADQDRFYLDQSDRDITDWIFEPVTVDGVSNAYKIMAKATPEGTGDRSFIANDFYIGAADGELSDDPQDFTWQLVSREERLAHMQKEVSEGHPVDVSWLIPWFQVDRNNMRDRLWTRNTVNNNGGGDGFDGPRGYPVKEFWHMITTRFSYTLTDLPEGTYGFAIQAYYRDTALPDNDDNREAGDQLVQRYLDGTENLRAKYFAGAESATVMSIFGDAKDAAQDGYTLELPAAGKWVPNSMNDAGRAMINGAYKNEMIEVGVSDGVLTLGFEKDDADWRDWLIVGRFYLYYTSKQVKGEDLTPLQDQLAALIETGTALPQTPSLINALAEANESLSTATSSSALLTAIDALKGVVDAVSQSKDNITYFNETKVLNDRDNIDSTTAVEKFNTASTRGEFDAALKELRYTRRRAYREVQNDVFAGNEPQAGKFYLYNVGQKQFLCGGADWGAHAALGMPGVEIEFEAMADDENNVNDMAFHLRTGLNNGEQDGNPKEYLNYRGYMDAPKAGAWQFVPVDGKDKVYNIVQNDYTDVHVAWNPYASTDGGNGDETTVGTENRNLDPTDENAQWKIVSKAERDALIEKASIDNPVDLSFHIASPNFNQRENANSVWQLSGAAAIWGYGENKYDFTAEIWGDQDCRYGELSQEVEGLPAGIYAVYVNGYYRNGHHVSETVKVTDELTGEEVEEFRPGQPDLEQVSYAYLMAGDNEEDDTYFPNICSESGKAPGEGATVTSKDGAVYNYPQWCNEAANFFRVGLYKVHTVIEHDGDHPLFLGVAKEDGHEPKDWAVIDNFRVVYYGNATTKDAVKELLDESAGVEEVVTDAVKVTDNRIFNLQGVQVANPVQPGIYIQNGKKFVVK